MTLGRAFLGNRPCGTTALPFPAGTGQQRLPIRRLCFTAFVVSRTLPRALALVPAEAARLRCIHQAHAGVPVTIRVGLAGKAQCRLVRAAHVHRLASSLCHPLTRPSRGTSLCAGLRTDLVSHVQHTVPGETGCCRGTRASQMSEAGDARGLGDVHPDVSGQPVGGFTGFIPDVLAGQDDLDFVRR